MGENMITLSLYFEISDSAIYGGEGSIGYANTNVDLKAANLKNTDVCKYAEDQRSGVAELCKVKADKVRIISRTEYEENTDDD